MFYTQISLAHLREFVSTSFVSLISLSISAKLQTANCNHWQYSIAVASSLTSLSISPDTISVAFDGSSLSASLSYIITTTINPICNCSYQVALAEALSSDQLSSLIFESIESISIFVLFLYHNHQLNPRLQLSSRSLRSILSRTIVISDFRIHPIQTPPTFNFIHCTWYIAFRIDII